MKKTISAISAVFLFWSGPVQGQVVLSEVMYDPAGSEPHDEYVELFNTSQTEAVDLSGWHLGDEKELDRLVGTGAGMVIEPGQFALVLDGSYWGNSQTYAGVQNGAVLLTIEDKAFGHAGWSNSAREAVVLRHAAGDTVEVFYYHPVQQPGRSWEKVDLRAISISGNWELALVEGGTPGDLNSVGEHRQRAGQGVALEAAPNPFSQLLVLKYHLPSAPALVNLWVFDVEGVRIRKLMNGAPSGPRGEIEWDGLDQQGRAVLPGMYIVYLEASAGGVVTQKKKVVVRSAR